MKKELKPRKVKPLIGDDAWVYVNDGSIEVFIAKEGNHTLAAKLTRRQLLSILGL